MINRNFPKAVSLGMVKRNEIESIKKAGHARITKTTRAEAEGSQWVPSGRVLRGGVSFIFSGLLSLGSG